MIAFHHRRAVLLLALSAAAVVNAQTVDSGSSFHTFSASTSSASLLGLTPSTYLGATSGPNRFSNVRGEVHLDFSWYGAFGAGGRVEFPLAPNGILDSVDDEIALSLGGEFFFYYGPGYYAVTPIAAVQWNFFLNEHISIFPEVGVVIFLGNGPGYYGLDGRNPGVFGVSAAPYIGFGFRYHFSARNALLLRVSWPAGFQVGITF